MSGATTERMGHTSDPTRGGVESSGQRAPRPGAVGGRVTRPPHSGALPVIRASCPRAVGTYPIGP